MSGTCTISVWARKTHTTVRGASGTTVTARGPRSAAVHVDVDEAELARLAQKAYLGDTGFSIRVDTGITLIVDSKQAVRILAGVHPLGKDHGLYVDMSERDWLAAIQPFCEFDGEPVLPPPPLTEAALAEFQEAGAAAFANAEDGDAPPTTGLQGDAAVAWLAGWAGASAEARRDRDAELEAAKAAELAAEAAAAEATAAALAAEEEAAAAVAAAAKDPSPANVGAAVSESVEASQAAAAAAVAEAGAERADVETQIAEIVDAHSLDEIIELAAAAGIVHNSPNAKRLARAIVKAREA